MLYLNLLDGQKMPTLGLGTWQASETELENALNKALEIGYRHFDTAMLYRNESTIGRVLNAWIAAGKIQRNELFITTKLPPVGMYVERVGNYFTESLSNLNLGYIDLYLIHSPDGIRTVPEMKYGETVDVEMDTNVNHIAIWKEMEKFVECGLAKSIGISNFSNTQIQNILSNCNIRPSSLQIELHLYHQQKELVNFCKSENIPVVAYCPLGSPGIKKYFEDYGKKCDIPNLFENKIVTDIATKYNKTPAQILLRHTIQNGIGVIPKSSNPRRLEENFNIFDFVIQQSDMEKLDNVDLGETGQLTTWENWTWI